MTHKTRIVTTLALLLLGAFIVTSLRLLLKTDTFIARPILELTNKVGDFTMTNTDGSTFKMFITDRKFNAGFMFSTNDRPIFFYQ